MIHYLSVDDVIKIHDTIEPWPIIDRPGLESAVYQPRASYGGYEIYPTLVSKAAVLLRGLAYNHPFENANKRTALISSQVFLRINGTPMADEDDLVVADFVTDAVASRYTVEQITNWITERLA